VKFIFTHSDWTFNYSLHTSSCR